MSKTPEQLTYDWLKALPPEFDLQRIETSTSNGVPDFNLIVNTKELWMEVKAGQESGEGVKLRPQQAAWMKRRTSRGGQCLVLNRKETGAWSAWVVKKETEIAPAGATHVKITNKPDGHGSTIISLILFLNRL